MKVVHVDPGKEPLILLSHLSNEVIYEKGLRNQLYQSKTELYRLRIDSKFGTVRVWDVSDPIPYLVDSDSHFIIYDHKATLYKSRGISEASNLYRICKSILCQKKLEIPINIVENSSLIAFPTFKMENINLNPIYTPQFFRCSCALGYYSIEYLGVFSQDDLRPDCVVVLDCRPGPLFLWKGNEASDVVTQLTFRAIDIKRLKLEEKEDCPLLTVEQGKEPADFVVYFNVWEDEPNAEPSNSFLIQMKNLAL